MKNKMITAALFSMVFVLSAHAGMYSVLSKTMSVIKPEETKQAVKKVKAMSQHFDAKVSKYLSSDRSKRKKTVLRAELLDLIKRSKPGFDTALTYVPEKFHGFLTEDFDAITKLVEKNAFSEASIRFHKIAAEL